MAIQSARSVSRFKEKLFKEDITRVLVRGATGVMGVNMLGLALSFISAIVLARLMGASSYGNYVLALNWMQMLVLLSLTGMESALVRFVPEYLPKKNYSALKGVLRYSVQHVLISSSLVTTGVGIVLWRLQDRLSAELSATLWLSLLLIPLISLVAVREGGLRAFKQVVRAALPENVFRPLLLIFFVAILFFWQGRALTAPLVIGFTLLAVLVSLVVSSAWLSKTLPTGLKAVRPSFQRLTWIQVALPISFIVGMQFLLRRTDIFMIGAFLGSEEVAFYGAATRFADLGIFGLTAVNAIAAPLISELYSQGKRQALQKLVTQAAWGISLVTFAISLGLFVFGEFFLGIFGASFKVAYVPLLVLLIAQVISSLTGVVGFLMTMTGHHNQSALFVAAAAILNISLNAYMIPAFGLMGAAVATAITTALFNLALLIYVRTKLGFNPTVFKF